jgi:flagellin
MRIDHNISALNTFNQYSKNIVNSSKSTEKLSSGPRINRAIDDAASLSISQKMRSPIKGLTQAVRNAQDDMLVRVKELSVQVQNGTYNAADQANIGLKMKALGIAVNDILTKTTFNSIDVFGAGTKITYGEDGAQSVTIAKAITTDTAILKGLTDAAVKGVAGSIATKADVAAALAEDPSRVIVLGAAIPPVFADPARVTVAAVENAISEINTQRAIYGAQQNQLKMVLSKMS